MSININIWSKIVFLFFFYILLWQNQHTAYRERWKILLTRELSIFEHFISLVNFLVKLRSEPVSVGWLQSVLYTMIAAPLSYKN